MLFDSHCHLNFSAFADNYQEIIADCLDRNIGIINIGSQIDTSRRALEIANEYPDKKIYATIGLHPIHFSQTEVDEEEIKFKSREEKFDQSKYQKLIDLDQKNVETQHAKSPKIIAIGEIGLDYWYIPQDKDFEEVKELQQQGFLNQLNFAKNNNLPVIIHARGSQENSQDAYNDILQIINSLDYQLNGVVHCFGSTVEVAQEFLKIDFFIGFTGIITFKNKSVDELREVVKNIPLEKILVETDAPYLAPEPFRGQKNMPQYVEHVARQVALLKNVDYNTVASQTTANVKELFIQ